MSGLMPVSGLSFSLLTPTTTRFGPRLGNVVLKRPEQNEIQVHTPGFLTVTSRGVIPHLSRDHYGLSGISWVNVPFENFLEVIPPVPTLVRQKYPLHSFLGFSTAKHIVSMSARDPADGREMPPNGNTHISANCLRGVRKVSFADWRTYVHSCKPDFVFALSDIPFTNPPYSQKRLTKSIERSVSWLANMLAPSHDDHYLPNVLVHMAGSTSISARKAFAESLVEKLFGPDADAIMPLETLDQGVTGYTFDLVPIRLALDAADKRKENSSNCQANGIPLIPSALGAVPVVSSETNFDFALPSNSDQISPLLRASLEPVPTSKLRLVNTVQTPHEILRLITVVGIDVFDAYWVQRAAGIGVALDFSFPAPSSRSHSLKLRENGKYDIGHNLYDGSYTHDFSRLGPMSCTCRACAPIQPSTKICHGIDDPFYTSEALHAEHDTRTKPGVTRAYIHHLLHTHEMSAHSLLVLHNLAVLDDFFAGIRSVIRDEPQQWDKRVQRFMQMYDGDFEVFDEARVMWRDVDLARGKGRLAREKLKQEEEALVTAVGI